MRKKMKSDKLSLGLKIIIGFFIFLLIMAVIATFIEPWPIGPIVGFILGIPSLLIILGLSERLNYARVGTIIFSSIMIVMAIFNIFVIKKELNLFSVINSIIYGTIIIYLSLPEIKEIFE